MCAASAAASYALAAVAPSPVPFPALASARCRSCDAKPNPNAKPAPYLLAGAPTQPGGGAQPVRPALPVQSAQAVNAAWRLRPTRRCRCRRRGLAFVFVVARGASTAAASGGSLCVVRQACRCAYCRCSSAAMVAAWVELVGEKVAAEEEAEPTVEEAMAMALLWAGWRRRSAPCWWRTWWRRAQPGSRQQTRPTCMQPPNTHATAPPHSTSQPCPSHPTRHWPYPPHH